MPEKGLQQALLFTKGTDPTDYKIEDKEKNDGVSELRGS
jgi:hypothetical protein